MGRPEGFQRECCECRAWRAKVIGMGLKGFTFWLRGGIVDELHGGQMIFTCSEMVSRAVLFNLADEVHNFVGGRRTSI